ncbi:MAG: nucleotidyl transferase AbiEii/AbiGii toxin family protein [Chitinivibrionales bacterium]|nr:nucleotidyl transferase AbiEii/AbiGii toxin family protein [Chitinivibrionales bacterium]
MPIAPDYYFTSQAIQAHAFEAPIELAEQAVFCLELVAELVDAGLDFQFKGGNSLLLVLDRPKRFSIDVDIATNEGRERIEQCLEEIIKKHHAFTRWEKRQHATKPWLPLASFYLFYKSQFTKGDQVNIMLDAQLTRSPYKTQRLAVKCGELYQAAILAEVPLPASIIGDKLLTLGPRTLGIPLGKKKEAQRLKHVFDVSRLLETNPVLGDIRASLIACVTHENKLQGKDISLADLLTDTLALCKSIVPFGEKPELSAIADPILIENVVGIGPFRDHLFSKDYSWQKLQLEMARVALCMTAVCVSAVSDGMFARALGDKSNDAQYYWEIVGEWLKLTS